MINDTRDEVDSYQSLLNIINGIDKKRTKFSVWSKYEFYIVQESKVFAIPYQLFQTSQAAIAQK